LFFTADAILSDFSYRGRMIAATDPDFPVHHTHNEEQLSGEGDDA
jgi:hypothetical protein